MSLYRPPISRDSRGYTPAPLPPVMHFETTLPSSYELEQQGYRIQSEIAVPLFRGEIIQTRRNEVRRQVVTVVTANQTYEEEITIIDVGTTEPQVVYDSEVDTEHVDYEYDYASETTTYVEPTTHVETAPVVTYQPPPVEYAEQAYVAVEPSSTYTSSDYTYTASGTASATTDLIGYGVLNQDGTEAAPVYDPYSDPGYISNLEAQYG